MKKAPFLIEDERHRVQAMTEQEANAILDELIADTVKCDNCEKVFTDEINKLVRDFHAFCRERCWEEWRGYIDYS